MEDRILLAFSGDTCYICPPTEYSLTPESINLYRHLKIPASAITDERTIPSEIFEQPPYRDLPDLLAHLRESPRSEPQQYSMDSGDEHTPRGPLPISRISVREVVKNQFILSSKRISLPAINTRLEYVN